MAVKMKMHSAMKNDGDDTIYPGRNMSTHDPEMDYNCNGIYGTNNNGEPWENVLCGDSQPRGVMVLGDSAAAHFSIPFPNKYINHTTPLDWATLAEDEGDWPACSWSTAYWSTEQCPWSPLQTGVNSIYLQMRNRNLCNHRDYQNIAVDGARSPSMNDTIVHSIARNQKEDHPLLVFYALVGNDVCNGHPGFGSMTLPSEFYENVVGTMGFLDHHLPPGSHVFFIGLESGELIWPIMHDQMHPLGVTYENLWAFLTCNNVNSCWGWLNPDPNDRNKTTQRAQELNAVFPQIVAEKQYKNFDMHYLGNFMKSNIQQWVNSGGNPVDFFEIVGGGHPSQLAHEMDAAAIWNALMTDYPDAIGPVNPNNQLIQQLFGDQGGY